MRIRGRGDHALPFLDQATELHTCHRRDESPPRALAHALHPRAAPLEGIHNASPHSAGVFTAAERAGGGEGAVWGAEGGDWVGGAEGGELCAVDWDEPCRARGGQHSDFVRLRLSSRRDLKLCAKYTSQDRMHIGMYKPGETQATATEFRDEEEKATLD